MKSELRSEEIQIFDFFLAGVLSMRCHPGTTRDGSPNWTYGQMAQMAYDMVVERRGWLPKHDYGPSYR